MSRLSSILSRAGVLACASALVVACQPDEWARRREQNVDGTSVPKCTATDTGASYTGFGGTKLTEGRIDAAVGVDRARVKPYAALRAEYERVIGVAPTQIENARAAFSEAPERFSFEPSASAISVYSAFRLAFDACVTYAEGVPDFADAPTDKTAPDMCSRMARTFWSRAATKKEVDACVKVATVDSAAEEAPTRRWAYTCAALLSSAGFLTY